MRKRPEELFPTSKPSPVRSSEHVSTHTRSPRPSGRIAVTFARVRVTARRPDSRRARTAGISRGEDGIRKIPSTPTSIVSRNNFASAASWTSTRSRVPLPWKCAIKFSDRDDLPVFRPDDDMFRRSTQRADRGLILRGPYRREAADRFVIEREDVVRQEDRREVADALEVRVRLR